MMLGDNSTFDTLFSDFDLFEQQNQEPLQQIVSLISPETKKNDSKHYFLSHHLNYPFFYQNHLIFVQ
jgi:hypothetical protein